MSLMDYRYKEIPRYYKTMYQDGFSPEEIWFAAKQDLLERAEQPDDFNVNVNSKIEVKK